ncbi:MAG: radical SAM protein [Nitrospina sp.]|nr:radical SAM protein [Nitrospina sp.]MBT4103879.1 radical SAM protein [Nitrospina sp.]MBT4388178.1 radical SAM protein [Nitrospina sp.]MBT4620393.1 radical SAM protein [Nitrospina sp.]MBT5260471.1 radical SAM protein [Nitrospina sp.]
MNIIVANSVGIDRDGYHMVHVPSRWSLGVKNFTNCGYYPWELAYTSSLLKRETNHHVKFLDGVLNGWDFETYFTHASAEKPDWLIMESSTRTIREDLRLASALKETFGTKLILTGQHPMAHPEDVLKVADYVCIGEYEFTVLDLIQGKNKIAGVHPNARGPLIDINALPFPEDDDVRRIDYHEPNCRYKQIQMYASRGCPRRCNFCAAATLYYDELNWRPRNVDSVVEEIRTLHEKYPEMEGVFFDEEVHNIKRSFNISLAKAIRSAGLDHLKYEAMCEYASLDEEALEEMRSAGYYKIRFGIETGSDKVAEKMTLGKKHDLDKLRSMVKFGKSLGMLIYGTISIGGLGSSREEDQKTVDLVYEMASKGWLDEIQVSINTPQPGTDFYNSCVEKSLLSPATNWEGFDGNGQVVVHYPHYPAEEIQSSFKKALSAFDLGKEKSQSGTFSENAKSSFNLIPEGARVLVLRSVRNWMVRLILENLNNNVDLLGQDVSAKDLEGLAGLNQIHSYGSGFFSAESISTDLIEKLRNEQYDFILVPVANNHLQGFQNVLEVAQQIDPENIFYVYPEGHLQPASDSPVAI